MVSKAAILIAGPTASGKSAAAMRFAHCFDGVIVNADSMQVYTELRVLTARPSVADEAVCPHRLYGHVSASDGYSAGRWLADVENVLAEIDATGKRAVFVGGTGLYFKALTEGLSPMPPVRQDIRAHWREEALRLPAAELHAELARVDPLTADGLNPNDTQRIVRALEVAQSTGRPLAVWQQEPGVPLIPRGCWRGFVIAPPRDVNVARADRRFEDMLETGALDEVRRIMALGLSSELPAMRALGVIPLSRHLSGELSMAEAAAMGKSQTRQYIKRQMTWLRRHMISWKWIKS